MRDRIVFLSMLRQGAIVLVAVLWTGLWWWIGALEGGHAPGKMDHVSITAPACDSVDPWRYRPLTEQTYHDYDNVRKR